MSWKFGSWQDFLKKKACRYILQHYLGQFLQQKLSLDQLSLDLYNGTGKITDLNLDVQAINDDLSSLGVPVELVDGFVDTICVSIPWSALIQDNTKLEVSGLELTLQPKQREDNGMMAGEMFSSMQSSMTTSLQLAKDCLESETERAQKTEPIEGVQKFASMIDSVLSKIKVSLVNTVIRIEHQPEGSARGVALEIKIKRIEYFDDMATSADGTTVDGKFEPAAITHKNLHIEGVQLFFDEISSRRTSASRSRSSSEGSPSQMFVSAKSTASGGTSVYQSKTGTDLLSSESNPIQIATITGRQEIKLKTKQNDNLQGPKLEIVCQFGALHILLSPRQLHGLLELLSALNSPESVGPRKGRGSRMKNRPMEHNDMERVEYELQHQLQSGRIHSNNLANMQEYSLHGEDDDQFFALMGARPTNSDMDSSYSSAYSASSMRTNSTAPSGISVNRPIGRGQKNPFPSPKYHEDPTAELSRYQVRVAFFSVTVFHNNPNSSTDNPGKTCTDMLKEIAAGYFQRVTGVTVAGISELKEVRNSMTDLLSHDHLRLLGRPLSLECSQKSALKQVCTNLHVSMGIGELVETLYCTRGQHVQPEYSEIITFKKDGGDLRHSAMYSSMQGSTPCISLQLTSYTRKKSASRLPHMDINLCLGELHAELDVTLVDRINALITPEKITTPNPLTGASMYHTVGNQFYSLSETLNEGSSGKEQEVVLEISSTKATVNIRFPIPDLRQESHVDKSWYQRNLREDALCVELNDLLVRSSFITGQDLEEIQISSSEINGYFKFKLSDVSHHFAHVMGEGEGFNNPTITLGFCNKARSVLDDDTYVDDHMPGDSLNGACSELGRPEPSPFSCRRHMHDKHEGEPTREDNSEQMVLPADRDEVKDFMDHSLSNTKMEVKIVLPNVCIFITDKHFFEVLYNRLNNDMLLWEPSAPAPVTVSHEHFSCSQNMDLNVYNQLLHTGEHFEMAKSGLQMDSDSDEDTESINHYSIHDSRMSRRRKTPPQQQSKMCLSLTIDRGRITAFTDSKDTSGVLRPDKHGEVLMQVSDFLLFTVSSHNGDPNLQYLNILANRADLYHHACVSNDETSPPRIHCSEITQPVPSHLQANHVIYRTEPGVLVNAREPIGCGSNSQDMLAVALRIKIDTSKRDLISDEKVKEFLVSLGIRGASMRHKVSQPYQNVFTQLMDFLDVRDYPILGYVDPKVLTELHVHLWTCAIDYRPLYLPLKSVILAESFTISSNIVAESAISVLRFVLDDGSLFISNKEKRQKTDLKKDYVCVADIGRLELLLRSNAGNNPHYPKTELQVSSNLVNIRTCADSCMALIDLIQYVASDGDLLPPVNDDTLPEHVYLDPDPLGDRDREILGGDTAPLTRSSADHLHNLMTDAMLESTDSNSSSEPTSPDASRNPQMQTEVFFVPHASPSGTDSPTAREPIVITQNVDSVSSSMVSSTMSGLGGAGRHAGDEGGSVDSDDFCMIDDAGWGTSLRDGEPTVRVFTEQPIEIKDNFFSRPVCRTDLLKAPETFPMPVSRYTLKELTLVWHIYGGSDLALTDCEADQEPVTADTGRDSLSVSYHHGGGCNVDRWSGHAAGREVPIMARETLQTRGGSARDTCKCMEVQLSKVRFQHEEYPGNTEQASRQVLLISDIEIRDKLKSSRMNKFLYQYYSDELPKQTYANMVHIRAIHSRPNPAVPEEECALKVSLQPIRLNIDQDTLFFLKCFFVELSGKEEPDVSPRQEAGLHTVTPPPPVMQVNKDTPPEMSTEPHHLLMQFDELTHDLQASLRGNLGPSSQGDVRPGSMKSSVSSSDTITSDTTARPVQRTFFKSFIFSHDVPIRLDYHGKFDREHGTLGGLGGLVSLNRAELRLKRLTHKQGLLGSDKVLSFCLEKWLEDIRVNQLPTILGGFGPLHAFVQLAHGLKDLFWMPVEQYKKDGRIIRGIQRGATSFSMSTAMSLLELTNRLVQSVQWCAELTFDMVSPGPRRRGYYPRQPADLREGVSNAYIVLREGFSDTATNMVDAATKEHSSKGMMGAVGGVLRQIPPTIVHPLIIVPEAASNVIGGLKSQLKPDAKKEDEDKWKEEIID